MSNWRGMDIDTRELCRIFDRVITHGASAACGAGAYGEQSWNLLDPSIHTTHAGLLVGGGASIGAGGGFTWVW